VLKTSSNRNNVMVVYSKIMILKKEAAVR